MKLKAGSDVFYDILLYVYIIFLGSVCASLAAAGDSFLSINSLSSDAERFLYLLETGNITSFMQVNLKNIIYTVFAAVSGKSFLSMIGTSFLLYAFSLILLYRLANMHKNSRLYGIFAVLAVNTMTHMLSYVYGLNLHISETLFVLLLLYCFEKSNYFTKKVYAGFYLLFACMAFCERESIIMYMGLIVLFTSMLSYRKQKYNFVFYNGVVLLLMAVVTLSGSNHSYIMIKLGHFAKIPEIGFAGVGMLFYGMLKTMWSQIVFLVSNFYLYCILFFAVVRVFFKRETKNDFSRLVDWSVFCLLGLYFLTVNPAGERIFAFKGPSLFDILSLFFLLSLSLVNYFYRYRKYKIYLICGMVACLFLSSSNLVPYNVMKVGRLGQEEVYENLTNSKEAYRIGTQLPSLLRSLKERNILFVMEKLQTKGSMLSDAVYKNKYERAAEFSWGIVAQQTFLFFMCDLVTLEGFLEYGGSVPVDAYVVETVRFPSDRIYKSVFFYKKKSRLDQNKFYKLHSWKVALNEKFFFYVHAYAVEYDRV